MTSPYPVNGGPIHEEQFAKLFTFNFAGAEVFTMDLPAGFYHIGFSQYNPGTIVGSPAVKIRNWANSGQTVLSTLDLAFYINGMATLAALAPATGTGFTGFMEALVNSDSARILPIIFVPFGLKVYSTAGTSGTGYLQMFAQRVC